MHEISKTAFTNSSMYVKDKIRYVKKCFTQIRISFDDQISPRSSINADAGNHKIGRKVFGEKASEEVNFIDTGIQLIDNNKKVIETTKTADIQYVQFGVIRRMTTFVAPSIHYELSITIGTSAGNYYLLNENNNLEIYKRLTAWCEEQNILIEDPFDLASVTTGPATWTELFDGIFVTQVAKAVNLNYPEEVQTNIK